MNHQPKKQDRTIEWCVGAGVGIFCFCILSCIVKVGLDQLQYADAVASPERVTEEIRMQLPKPPAGAKVKVTTYGEAYRGKPMALNGQPFDPDKMTCAHRTLGIPGGPPVYVRFTRAGLPPVTCEVTDRGPWDKDPKTGRYRKDFDLSTAAFRALSPNMTGGEGLQVTAEVVAR